MSREVFSAASKYPASHVRCCEACAGVRIWLAAGFDVHRRARREAEVEVDTETYQMHLLAGRTYGQDATCGRKVDYRSEEAARASAEKMSIKFQRLLEEYPCTWCGGWHIGRAFTAAEIAEFTAKVREVNGMTDL